MEVLIAPTIRDIVKKVNEYGIPREKVVTLMKDSGSYILVYYR